MEYKYGKDVGDVSKSVSGIVKDTSHIVKNVNQLQIDSK